MMPFNGMDYEKTTEPLDIIEFNPFTDLLTGKIFGERVPLEPYGVLVLE